MTLDRTVVPFRTMRSFLHLSSFAVVAVGGIVWLSSSTAGCGGSDGAIAPPEMSDASVGGDGGTDTDDPDPVCGNKIKERVEQCDDGNSVNGDGCENDCTLTCKPGADGDRKCNDGDACNGVETCGADNKCARTTPPADGTSCGDAKFCKGGLCIGITCGDSVVSAGEECDDGNAVTGDGCDNCKFSCLSTDAARNCGGGDPCAGTSTCDDATHKCSARTPLADGATCGTDKVCKAGVCGAGACGDGVVTGTEQCDFGAANGAGTGCEIDCKFSCSTTADTCSDANACNGVESCKPVTVSGKTGQKCTAGTPLAENATCATGRTCKSGFCASALCGNGTIDTGEDCDFGAGLNVAGSGCQPDCKFTCANDTACSDANACNGTEVCQAVVVGGKNGKKCAAGTALAACATCGTGGAGVCVTGLCKTPACGDSCVTAPETCEPKSTATCDASCKTIKAAVCGDGVRDLGERCDDTATVNLDGCDALCQFEQSHRANEVKMQYGAPGTTALCAKNALGGAIGSSAQGQLNTSLDNGVKDGSISIMFRYLGLDDLGGSNDAALQLGSVTGKPVLPTGAVYDGTNAIDWWYTADATAIDGTRIPTAKLDGKIVSKLLTAGPGRLTLLMNLGAMTPSALDMHNVKVRETLGAATAPLMSTGTAPPGHLASEHLDPALTSFVDGANGELCGDVSSKSLSLVPAPGAISGNPSDGGTSISCNSAFTTSSTLLDVLVRGCTVLIITAVRPTQPDITLRTIAGTAPPYKFTLTGTKVTGCTDSANKIVPLADCLDATAYSSWFRFKTQRVIIK